ncbi:EamA family transporter [Croceibacter atlanticus]|jgi:drug/metabolite transporter (DMT)-like permease|uniref:Transporter, putative n=1 Tax=Croceibacter atlanticus (strain ATCC BAA-628 / JCM 21780 / CIP 108009 / IAM 15332 / KCTC 12090 / HTCC2559) TaxID=216432 RepID=A3U980_CROAH|nr:EamA family transporter [Croceibacter atlanticus]EAP86366.1 transporter, putative [Croceibacter atlanticus HTCC2559]
MKSNPLLIIVAFFSIYVFWGSTYVMNKLAVTELDPLMLACIRFTAAGSLIFIIAKCLKLSLKISKKQLLNCALAGFLFLAYGNGMFVWALQFVDSGFAAIEASLQPLLILVLMRIVDRKPIKLKSVVGIILGIIGIYLLVSQQELTTQEGSVLGMLVIFTCVLSWCIGSVFVSKAELPKNFFVNTGYQMLLGGFMLGIASVITGETWSFPTTWQTSTQLSLLGLIFFGSIAAFTSFNYLLKVVSTEKVATSAYINPIIAIFLGWYFLDETITTQTLVSAAVLLTGVYFINSSKKMKKGKKFT